MYCLWHLTGSLLQFDMLYVTSALLLLLNPLTLL